MKNKFYTLLYIDKSEKKRMSTTGINKAKDLNFQERINIFLGCAALLDKSLQYNQVGNLNILTNDKEFVDNSLQKRGFRINVIDLSFSLHVPHDINFYSAHFKIDVFKYLGGVNSDEVSFLLDNDVVCTNSLPKLITQIEEADYNERKRPLLIYQMPRYGGERMVHDKQKVDPSQIHGLWAGGEFIAGTAAVYADLYNEIMKIQEGYWNTYKTLFHQGDEMLTSVALERMFYGCQHPILDAHGLGLIKRYWSILDKEPFYKEDYWLVHLPYDKGMVSSLNLNSINSNEDFEREYKSYWNKLIIKKHLRKIATWFRNLAKK